LSLRNKILGTACALALGAFAAPAYASNFSGTIDGEYANLSANGGGGHANSWGGNGSGVFDTGWSNLALQGDIGYHNLSASGTNVNLFDIAATPFLRMDHGRLGVTVGYTDAQNHGSTDITNYGGFGEWFAGHAFTVGVKGGGFNANHGLNGAYVGAQLTGYVMPDFSLAGSVDYTSFSHSGHETDYNATAEYLISETTPISVFGGYTYSEFSGSSQFNTWMIGLKFYCNGTGASTLVDRQRAGNVGWAAKFTPLAAVF